MVLGPLQGLTAFPPVSSSGRLILVPRVFGWPDQGLAVDAALHLGTLAALLAYFPRELPALAPRAPSPRPSPLLLALSTAAWALVMWVADRRAARAPAGPRDPLERLTWPQGLAVGCAQALALIPGTSRSGITITTGLFGGLDRATAARFSFLLGIPITAGAGGLELLRLLRGGLAAGEGGPLVAALFASFLSGWLAVWFMVAYLRTRSLAPFVVYRLALAAVIVAVALR